MINRVTYEFVGEKFIDWVRNGFDVARQDENFFSIFKFAIEKGKVSIYRLGADKEALIRILRRNKNTISYCEGITDDTNYICEDSVHKVFGFNALTDIGFPFLQAHYLGGEIMRLYRNFNDIDEKTQTMLDNFSDYLAPRIMTKVIDMTIEFMGEEGKCINRDWLEECWGYLNDTPNHEWIASFDNMMMWDTCGDFIEDHLCECVINVAQGNVYGVKDSLDVSVIEEIREEVSTRSWFDIFAIWQGDKTIINEIRATFGITEKFEEPWEEKDIDEYFCDIHFTKELRCMPNDIGQRESHWWTVGVFTEGQLWMNNYEGEIILETKDRILKSYI